MHMPVMPGRSRKLQLRRRCYSLRMRQQLITGMASRAYESFCLTLAERHLMLRSVTG